MMTTRKNPGVGAKHVDGAAKRPPKYLATKCMYYKVAFVPMEYTKNGKPYHPNNNQRYNDTKDNDVVAIELQEKEEFGIVKVAYDDNIIIKYRHMMIEAAKVGIELPWYAIDKKDNYPAFKMHVTKMDRLPKDFKEIRHVWKSDNFMSVLPLYSNFAVACRDQISKLEPGNNDFEINVSNMVWKLRLVKESPFIYLVEDRQKYYTMK